LVLRPSPGIRRARAPVAVILVSAVMELGWARAAEPPKLPEMSERLLSAATFKQGWTFFSPDKNGNAKHSWKLIPGNEPVLKCIGKPIGYARTVKEYDDFELTLDWMYPDDRNGNSGVLIYTSGEDKIWPTAIQIQLHMPVAGTVIPTGNAKPVAVLRKQDLKLPVGMWHTCRILSQDGKVTVFINQQRIGQVTGCEPRKGAIALQSENSEIHFRKIIVRPLKAPPDEEETEKKVQSKEGHTRLTPGKLQASCGPVVKGPAFVASRAGDCSGAELKRARLTTCQSASCVSPVSISSGPFRCSSMSIGGSVSTR
jgi:hypothetical protein